MLLFQSRLKKTVLSLLVKKTSVTIRSDLNVVMEERSKFHSVVSQQFWLYVTTVCCGVTWYFSWALSFLLSTAVISGCAFVQLEVSNFWEKSLCKYSMKAVDPLFKCQCVFEFSKADQSGCFWEERSKILLEFSLAVTTIMCPSVLTVSFYWQVSWYRY